MISEKLRKERSERMKKNNPNNDPLVRKKKSESLKKYKKTPEHCKNISKANKGRKSSRKGKTLEQEYGKERAEEIRKKIKEAREKQKVPSGKAHYNYRHGKSVKIYGCDWQRIRKKILIRDKFTCQKCGIKEKDYGSPLDIHHLIPFKISKDNSLKNLITLCRRCHMTEERKISKKFYKKEKQI